MAKDVVSSGTGALVAMFTALFGVAVVAVLVSQRAQTAKVLEAFGQATGGVISAAIKPVTE